jgi:crotonobetainyl-CoA:carnitine CoA-transferase CaiB-like acyl-CoA transferase
MKQPLEDIKVLDLSRVYAAPAGAMILGDLGADVIRIEHPEGSDSTRDWGPFINGESTYYLSANRNKRSVTLNLKSQKGKDLFLELVKNADVIIENFKTGTMERMGLGYGDLKKVNEKIIHCSVTGFGHSGPAKENPGFDPVIQAVSGLMDVTGQANGEATKVGVPMADILTSNYVVISILAAIRMRDFNHVGQHIDLSLLDVQMSSLANVASSYLNGGTVSKRVGNSHNNVVPYQVFQCADKPIMLSVGNDRLFANFCRLVERPEWPTDKKYATNEARKCNEDELVQEIKGIMETRTAEEWILLLSEYKIPAGKVNTIEEAVEQPQVRAREAVEKLVHPVVGEIQMIKNPMRFSDLNITSRYAPPLLGEHTATFFKEELGIEGSELEKLRKDFII